ncbi:MAG TPA: thiamine phosphate synthase [Candidatus Binatia bacterium]|jgi:thiamine-phosphate pyrophosphorylase
MPLTESLPPLYAILDPEQTGNRSPLDVLRDLLNGGTALVQLRAKLLSAREFLHLARETRALTRSFGCRLIVNDRSDIALACGADGVHLGQEDLPLCAARKLLPQAIIGVSTHSLAQARAAERDGADYIGFGPMFGTKTKETGYSARGVDMLRELRAAVKLPIAAIGGIAESNVREVWRAGADSAAIISDILKAERPAEKVKRILDLSSENNSK